jgi:hypothetical protein
MVKGLLKLNQDYRVVNAAIPDYIHWTTNELGIVSLNSFRLCIKYGLLTIISDVFLR